MLLREVYESAKVVSVGATRITVNEFTDQLPALRPEVLLEAARGVIKVMDWQVDKIVTEEDKGAPLATAVSILTGIPMAMARWYTYSLDAVSEICVDLQSEYYQGKLYLNGVAAGDRVIIIDDTLSTGGAINSLVEAVRRSGGEVVDIVCAIEKIQGNGRKYVFDQTGMIVKSLVRITLSDTEVMVLD